MGGILENWRMRVRDSVDQWGTWGGPEGGTLCAGSGAHEITEGTNWN